MRFGITKKLELLYAALILFLVSFLSFYFIGQETTTLSSELDERGALLLHDVCVNAELPLLAQDKDELARIAAATLTQNDIVYCRVENVAGTVLFERGVPDTKETRRFEAPVLTRMAAETEGIFLGSAAQNEERVGKIVLGVSLAGLNRKVGGLTSTVLILALITILLMSAASSFLFRFVLMKPIAALMAGTERIAGGDLEYKVQAGMNDELGHLACAFNKMTDDLSKTLVSKKYVDNVIRSMGDCLVVTDHRGNIERINRAAVNLFGYSEEELSGEPLSILFDDASAARLGINDSSSLDRIDRAEIVCVSKTGESIPVQFSSSPMSGESGEVRGVVCVARDITERKRAEETLARQAETLATANADLERANAELQQLDRLKSDFISNVSHELRTPLTAIKAYAETLQLHASLSRTRRENFLGIIVEQTDRLTSVIEDLLDLSRIEAGKLRMSLEPIDVQETIHSAMENVLPIAKKKGVHVLTEPLPAGRVVVADRLRLVQVLVNLLNNGIKFTGSGGTVRLSAEVWQEPGPGTAGSAEAAASARTPAEAETTSSATEAAGQQGHVTTTSEAAAEQTGTGPEPQPGYLLLTVSDNGIGIPRTELARIFDKFKQVEDVARGKPSGTGLGLSICRELVERMGGNVWAESEEGVGSQFHFTLPLAGETEDEKSEASEMAVASQ